MQHLQTFRRNAGQAGDPFQMGHQRAAQILALGVGHKVERVVAHRTGQPDQRNHSHGGERGDQAQPAQPAGMRAAALDSGAEFLDGGDHLRLGSVEFQRLAWITVGVVDCGGLVGVGPRDGGQ